MAWLAQRIELLRLSPQGGVLGTGREDRDSVGAGACSGTLHRVLSRVRGSHLCARRSGEAAGLHPVLSPDLCLQLLFNQRGWGGHEGTCRGQRQLPCSPARKKQPQPASSCSISQAFTVKHPPCSLTSKGVMSKLIGCKSSPCPPGPAEIHLDDEAVEELGTRG